MRPSLLISLSIDSVTETDIGALQTTDALYRVRELEWRNVRRTVINIIGGGGSRRLRKAYGGGEKKKMRIKRQQIQVED